MQSFGEFIFFVSGAVITVIAFGACYAIQKRQHKNSLNHRRRRSHYKARIRTNPPPPPAAEPQPQRVDSHGGAQPDTNSSVSSNVSMTSTEVDRYVLGHERQLAEEVHQHPPALRALDATTPLPEELPPGSAVTTGSITEPMAADDTTACVKMKQKDTDE